MASLSGLWLIISSIRITTSSQTINSTSISNQLQPNPATKMKYFAAVVAVLGLCVSNAAAISCGDQAGNRGALCTSTSNACPEGFKAVFYDNPAPCRSGQRCCVQG